MLERFRKAQEENIARLKESAANGLLPPPYSGRRVPFAESLLMHKPVAVIAEFKRASPSLGDINLRLSPESVALAYTRAGAGAISVLTEQAHFKGDLSFLERMSGPGLPLLRKDFLLHPLQVRQTAATPASALLLIVRMLDQQTLENMLLAARETRLEAVLEIFDREDLDRARAALDATGFLPAVIQVNNRNLDKLTMDDTPSRELIQWKSEREVWISASGIHTRTQVLECSALGFDAVLVGSSIMAGEQPGLALAALTGKPLARGLL